MSQPKFGLHEIEYINTIFDDEYVEKFEHTDERNSPRSCGFHLSSIYM